MMNFACLVHALKLHEGKQLHVYFRSINALLQLNFCYASVSFAKGHDQFLCP